MKTDQLFETARRSISRSIIERYLHQPGAHWKDDEYWTLNPLRGDKHIGSFHISAIGQWFDHAINEGGDLIELLSKRDGLTLKAAAEKIIADAGGQVQAEEKNEKKKVEAVVPIPEEAFKALNDRLESDWSSKKFGIVTAGWKWKDARGAWCCTARHEREGADGKTEKDIIPYYYGKDGKWRQGNPISENRPIYRIDELPAPDSCRVLVVEGEKCADVQVSGYFVTTWIGGTGQVKKTKWATLKKYDVTIWPDNDKPGRTAAAYIKEQLPKARVINIKDKPEKWDIFDAQKDGIDLITFIEENCHDENTKNKAGDPDGESGFSHEALGMDDVPVGGSFLPGVGDQSPGEHFIHLGYDESRHYFLPRGANIVKRIGQGSFNKTKILELAPLSWWMQEFPRKAGFEVDAAIDALIRDSEQTGMFQPQLIRGTGVWLHDDKIIINNGHQVTDEFGAAVKLSQKYHYVKSDKHMANYRGEISTVQQGYDLIDLFTTQGFETEFEALALLGWTLIAPFGGILKWRPHVWLTGPARSGKSYILENIIQPMVEPFYHRGTGKTSSPGIYRSIKNTACPILLDEMEPGKNANKDTIQKIEEKLELARNASSDFSSVFTLTSMSGSGMTEEFCVRSCFLFASILPYFSGEAVESRIIVSRLKNIKAAGKKIAKTNEILKRGVMVDPVIYQRRIFRKLKSILANLEIAKDIFMEATGDQRKSDNLAPIFSAIVALVNDTEVEKARIVKLIESFLKDFTVERTMVESDEDKLLFELLDFTVQLSPSERVSIAELIEDAAKLIDTDGKDERHASLQRNGIRIYKRNGILYLAVASSHSAIKRILSETMYAGNYFEVLKRHEANRGTHTVRFVGQAKRAVMLDWEAIRSRYFEERQDDGETGSLFANEVMQVF